VVEVFEVLLIFFLSNTPFLCIRVDFSDQVVPSAEGW
jgi:hypothetical protein